jgi:hypothetical protein
MANVDLARTLARELLESEIVLSELRYSDDQPRDDHGRFASGGSGDTPSGGSSGSSGSGGGSGGGVSAGNGDPLAAILSDEDPNAIDTNAGYQPFVDAETKQYDTLTSAQNEALGLYTGTAYSSINGALRGNQAMDAGTASIASDLDTAIDSNGYSLAADSTLYRGVNVQSGATAAGDLQAGQVLQDDAFLSTSASADIATQFSFAKGLDVDTNATTSYVLQLSAPAGTNYLIGSTAERELLLGRDTPMVVDSVDMDYQQGYLNIPRVYAHIGG